MNHFDYLRQQNVARARLWHPGFPDDEGWNLSDWSNAMGGECGEAQNVVKKIRRIETGLIGRVNESDKGPLFRKLAEEVADTVTYADLLLAKCDMELWPAIVNKFNEVSTRFGFPQVLATSGIHSWRRREQ